MTWDSWHSQSERLASDAHVALRRGDRKSAEQLFAEAAQAEAQALNALDTSKTRTLGITAVSAASLWLKAGELRQAETLAFAWLGHSLLPPFAVTQLRQLVQAVWTAEVMTSAGISFLPGQVLVSIKGGVTLPGGAPLDLIVEKVQTVQALFYRTIEFLKGVPHRVRGGPSSEIQEACRPWLFQAPAGSYQFSVAIQRPKQSDLFAASEPEPAQIAHHFIEILKASSSEDPAERLPTLVPSKEYRSTFLKLTRNLAPTGKNVSRVEIRGTDEPREVVLAPENRKVINRALRPPTVPNPNGGTSQPEPIEMRGILRALHLDKDWLELIVDGASIHISGLSDTVDDVIGAMVNRRVIVQALKKRRGFKFLDMETEE